MWAPGGAPHLGRRERRLAVHDLEPPIVRGHRKQRASVRRDTTEGLPGVGHRPAAEGPAIVRAQVGVTHDDAHLLERHAELLGDEQAQRRAVVLADVHLAGKGRYPAVARDVEPGAAARRPGPGGRGSRFEHHDQTVSERVEPAARAGLGKVPGTDRAVSLRSGVEISPIVAGRSDRGPFRPVAGC